MEGGVFDHAPDYVVSPDSPSVDDALDVLVVRDLGAEAAALDVPRDIPASSSPRLVGDFVSSATPSTPTTRLSGGFVWHGTGTSTRLQGWLR
jgi:hypothetical protein